MRTIRVLLLAMVTMFVVAVPASARNLTGIYVATFRDAVAYFNLTEQGAYLTGYFQVVSLDSTSPDGLKRINYHVTGSVSGSRAVLYVEGFSQLTADLTWNGFTADIPQQSGQIAQAQFRHSSVSEVNRLIAGITTYGQNSKYYANTQAELADSQTRLSNDLYTYRPQILNAIIAAKKKLAAALVKKQRADAKVVERQQIAAQAHKVADDAKAAAVTNDEQYAANDLQYKANSADYDVNSAKYDVNSAVYDVNSATSDLSSAKADLVHIDARIGQLRQIISRDKTILHIH